MFKLQISLLFIFIILTGLTETVKSQTNRIDSMLIYEADTNRMTVFIYKYLDKKKKGKITIDDSFDNTKFNLETFTPIDEIVKVQIGRDHSARKSCSVIYRYGTGYYFIAASNIDGRWVSVSKNIMSFVQLNEFHEIGSVEFAHRQPKVFKVKFTHPRTPETTFAEIGGKIEVIDCHTCIYK